MGTDHWRLLGVGEIVALIKIKVLFLINTLGGGGAERVLVNLVNHMDKSKFDITVETMFAGGINEGLLSSDVRYIKKNKLGIRGLSNIIRYIPEKALYRYYIGNNDYDIIVAYMHGAPTKVVAGCCDDTKKTVSWLHFGNPEKGSFFSFWSKKEYAIDAYKKMDAIVGVSQSVSNAFTGYFGKDKLHTLYNTNDTARIVSMAKENIILPVSKEVPLICTSGRLTTQKGFDRLISVAKKLWDEGHRFNILIMGSGPEEQNLKAQIQDLSASKFVTMMGFCENPYAVMKQCDFYISSSREEGLATVLTEALTLEMAIISTDVSGAKEVLGEHNEYGLVVENSEKGIYSGLKEFLSNQDLVEKYRKGAAKRAELFDTKHAVSKTEEFFEQLVSR